jgi:hypothetical protein
MIHDWYCVRFDSEHVYRDVRPPGGEPWSDCFSWASIVRVCFLTRGLYDSDELYVFTSDRPESYLMPTEADGTHALIDELIHRKLFPPDLMIQAVSTENELFCWPTADVTPGGA